MTVHATWNRRFWGFQILAFADHSYSIDIGSDHKPVLISIGWYRWRPDSIDFPRWRKLPPPPTAEERASMAIDAQNARARAARDRTD